MAEQLDIHELGGIAAAIERDERFNAAMSGHEWRAHEVMPFQSQPEMSTVALCRRASDASLVGRIGRSTRSIRRLRVESEPLGSLGRKHSERTRDNSSRPIGSEMIKSAEPPRSIVFAAGRIGVSHATGGGSGRAGRPRT